MEGLNKVASKTWWRHRQIVVCAVVATALFGGQAQATEKGLTQWAQGVQTIVPAILPPPGDTEFYSYLQYYSADRFNDSHGDPAISDFKANIIGAAQRVVHTWKPTLGGWNLSSGVMLAEANVKLEAAGVRSNYTGLTYIYITPLYLTRNTKTLHLLAGPGVYLPLGPYNKNRLANSTNNYTSFGLEIAATWMPNERVEISNETNFTVNGTNPDTHYRSGTYMISDFGLNFAPIKNPKWWAGVNGFYTKQFTDDTIRGAKVGDGFRLEHFAIGPQVMYYATPAVAYALKYQHEFIAHNGPQGDRFWFEVVVPLGHSGSK